MMHKPLIVAGITFPPGSRAHYEQRGGFFGWGAQRTLQHIHSPTPIALGDIRFSGLIYVQGNAGNALRVELSGDQTIDGWPCSAADVTLTRGPEGPALKLCWLAEPRMWKGQMMPAGSVVFLDDEAP